MLHFVRHENNPNIIIKPVSQLHNLTDIRHSFGFKYLGFTYKTIKDLQLYGINLKGVQKRYTNQLQNAEMVGFF